MGYFSIFSPNFLFKGCKSSLKNKKSRNEFEIAQIIQNLIGQMSQDIFFNNMLGNNKCTKLCRENLSQHIRILTT